MFLGRSPTGSTPAPSRHADPAETVPPLAVDQLPPVVRPHSCPEPLLTGPLDLAVSSRVMHFRSFSGLRCKPSDYTSRP